MKLSIKFHEFKENITELKEKILHSNLFIENRKNSVQLLSLLAYQRIFYLKINVLK